MFPTTLLSVLFVLLIFINHSATGVSHARDRRIKNNGFLESFLDKSRSKSPGPERLRCLPCILQMYLEKNKATKQERADSSSKPFSKLLSRNFYKGRLNLVKPFKSVSFGKELDQQKPTVRKTDYSFLFASGQNQERAWKNTGNDRFDNYNNYNSDEDSTEMEENYFDDIPSDLESSYITNSANDEYNYDINSEDYRNLATNYMHREVCETVKKWIHLNETRNKLGEKVRVLPSTEEGKEQFVHVFECKQTDDCQRCRNVEGNSRCRMVENYINLYHEVHGEKKWDYVVVPTHCTCEIIDNDIYEEECSDRNRN